MPKVRKLTAGEVAEVAAAAPQTKIQAREQQIATVLQGDAADLVGAAVRSLRALGYQVQPHGQHWRVRFEASNAEPTVLEAAALLSLAAGLDAALVAQIAARAAEIAPAAWMPALPDDLPGWTWELGEQGLRRLTWPTEGFMTMWQPVNRECILEARQIQRREAGRIAELRPDPRPPLAAVFAAMDSGAPLAVDLSVVDDNPFQTRQVYDDVKTQEIAASIKKHGLLQAPLGRRTASGRVQLAFGHTRCRAFRLLAADDSQFGHMPIVLRDLDDQTMFLHAWSENRDRKDLSPYEEAVAIQNSMKAFGWNQKAVAEKLGLDRSTVGNKLRLLNLPAAVLDQLRDGQISERQATALLPLMELPEALRALKQQRWLGDGIGYVVGVEGLIANASKLDSNRLRQAVEGMVRELTVSLAGAPWRDQTWDLGNVVAVQCAICPLRIKSSDRCPDKACAGVKEAAWRTRQADAGARAAGLPATIHRNYSDRDDLAGVNLDAIRQVAEEKKCGNLAVVFDDGNGYYPHKIKGHPNCYIICGHGPKRRCGCKQALARRADPAAGQIAKKRHDQQRIKQELIAPAEQAIAAALQAPTAATWRVFLERINDGANRKLPKDADAAAVLAALASALAASVASYHVEYGYYDSAKRDLARLLKALGADAPWATAPDEADVRAQTSSDEQAPAPQSNDPFYAPAAQAARDRAAALGTTLTYEGGWILGDAGPMSWPDLQACLAKAEATARAEGAAPAQFIAIRTATGGEHQALSVRLTDDLALHKALDPGDTWTITHRASGYMVVTLRTRDAGERAFAELAELDWAYANSNGKVDQGLRDGIAPILARYAGDIVQSAVTRQVEQEVAA